MACLYVSMHVCIYDCMYDCMYVCLYVCMYVYLLTVIKLRNHTTNEDRGRICEVGDSGLEWLKRDALSHHLLNGRGSKTNQLFTNLSFPMLDICKFLPS